jgi:hypothetical protein
MKKVVSSPMELIFRTLRDYNVSGEELETLILDLGMEDQMLRQLVLNANKGAVKALIEEKEQLETELNKVQIYYTKTVSVHITELLYKGVEYRVKITQDDGDLNREYTVSYLVNGVVLTPSNLIYDELITYIEENA